METNSPLGMLLACGMVLLIVGLVGAGVYYSIRQVRRQRQELVDRGFTSLSVPDPGLVERLFRLDPEKQVKNVYSLNRGAYQFFLFELWGRHSQDDSPSSMHTAALISPDFNLPRFMIFPNIKVPVLGGVMDWVIQKAAERYALQRVNFSECPAFAEAYLILGDDEAALRHFFDLGKLTRLADLKNYQVDALGDLVTFSRMDAQVRSNERPAPDKVSSLLDGAAVLYGILR